MIRKRLFISFLVHFLPGILFVFPVYSADDFTSGKNVVDRVGFYGKEGESDNLSCVKRCEKATLKNLLPVHRNYLPNWIYPESSGNTFCGFLLNYSQSRVLENVSFLKSLRSVVILC